VIWVLLLAVAVLVVGLFGALIAGRLGYDPMDEPVSSHRDPGLPESFGAADVTRLSFDTALRGYRMDQVDEVLDRLQERLAHQDAELARQRSELARQRAELGRLSPRPPQQGG
jgi:DivIVA domain-containing protein